MCERKGRWNDAWRLQGAGRITFRPRLNIEKTDIWDSGQEYWFLFMSDTIQSKMQFQSNRCNTGTLFFHNNCFCVQGSELGAMPVPRHEIKSRRMPSDLPTGSPIFFYSFFNSYHWINMNGGWGNFRLGNISLGWKPIQTTRPESQQNTRNALQSEI